MWQAIHPSGPMTITSSRRFFLFRFMSRIRKTLSPNTVCSISVSHAHAHKHSHTRKHTKTHTQTHARVHLHTHPRTHSRARTHSLIHTQDAEYKLKKGQPSIAAMADFVRQVLIYLSFVLDCMLDTILGLHLHPFEEM